MCGNKKNPPDFWSGGCKVGIVSGSSGIIRLFAGHAKLFSKVLPEATLIST